MVSKETYFAEAVRRFGRGNPERMDLAHWVEMVRSGESAYAAAARYLGEEGWTRPETCWCFDRFGMSRTRLGDGRVVCVGGEHEDHYDPDFCIYNDVVVVGPGDAVEIYGYPREVFGPTDFHTATLVGGRLILVGSLGYRGERQVGRTQVVALDLETMRIEAVEREGETPGWISRHHGAAGGGRADDSRGWREGDRDGGGGGGEDYVDNGRVFRLDVGTGRWTAHEEAWRATATPGEWPEGWRAVESAEEARFIADGLARSVRWDHLLFADEWEVVAKTGEGTLAALLRLRDDGEEWMVSEGPTWTGRAEEGLRYERYRGIEAGARRREGGGSGGGEGRAGDGSEWSARRRGVSRGVSLRGRRLGRRVWVRCGPARVGSGSVAGRPKGAGGRVTGAQWVDNGRGVGGTGQARSLGTRFPWTSVRRKSRPWKRKVSLRWSRPRRCRIVAWRSWTWTRSSTAAKPSSSVSPRTWPGLHAAAGEPHGEGVDVVVAAGRCRGSRPSACGRTRRPR